jgi:universal stress protein E
MEGFVNLIYHAGQERRETLDKNKYLVVVDPSQKQPVTINRMVEVIRQLEDRSLDIHVLIGFESDDKSDPDLPEEVVCSREWLNDLLKPLDDLGVTYTTDLFWTRHWRNSIIGAANRYECEVIMIAKASAENRRGIGDSKWELMRQADCEVVIIGNEIAGPIEVVVSAVQTQNVGDKEMDQMILDRGKFLADFYNAEFHVVNAYKDSEDFPDFALIQRMVDVPKENIHRDMGHPEDVVHEMTQRLNADLLVMGTKVKHSLRAHLRGNAGEKIMARLEIDMLVLS